MKTWGMIGLLFLFPLNEAQAGYGSAEAVMFLGGMSTAGVTTTTAGCVLTTFGSTPGAAWFAAALVIGGGVTITATTGRYHKELVTLLKVDHDTYLAGGEITPFLQGVYREVRTRSHELQLKDGPCVGGEIDELKMTEAIDKLVALAGNP